MQIQETKKFKKQQYSRNKKIQESRYKHTKHSSKQTGAKR